MFTQPLPSKNGNSELINDQYKFNSVFSGLLNIFYNQKEDNLKLESLLEKFSRENSNSYTLFWTLVQHFQFKGFKEAYLNSFNNLSLKIKKSEYGRIFYNDLMDYLKLSEKTKFPNLKFQDNDLYSSLGKKYTLIDFWYSSCKPCLDIFPVYKDLYKKYENKGFEIIGISNDRTKDRQKWQKIIADKDLDWKQYLDENGTKTKIYNINKFPTTFLLDSNGVIIKKDISPEELEEFLKKTN